MTITAYWQAYKQLCSKVDSFFQAAQEWASEHMHCESACADCCQAGLTVFSLEACCMAREMQRVSPKLPHPLQHRKCALLNERLECSIYTARPIVCRTQGLVMAEEETVMLPACGLNFIEPGLRVPKQFVLDLANVNKTLALLNLQFLDAHANHHLPSRVHISDIVANEELRSLLASLE